MSDTLIWCAVVGLGRWAAEQCVKRAGWLVYLGVILMIFAFGLFPLPDAGAAPRSVGAVKKTPICSLQIFGVGTKHRCRMGPPWPFTFSGGASNFYRVAWALECPDRQRLARSFVEIGGIHRRVADQAILQAMAGRRWCIFELQVDRAARDKAVQELDLVVSWGGLPRLLVHD